MKTLKMILCSVILLCVSYSNANAISTDQLLNRLYKIEHMKKIQNYSEEDVHWLAKNIYHEARGENLHGKMVVAFVTFNRVTNRRWPDTIKEVVMQKWQFSWMNSFYVDGIIPQEHNKKSWEESKEVAKYCLALYNDMVESEGFEMDGITKGSTFYFADYISAPSWSKKLEYIGKVGVHLLFRYPKVNKS